MRYFTVFVLSIFLSALVYATEQVPDYIEYETEISELEASWEYPSPLEVYFRISNKLYPFKELHTANYRGHVATWKLLDNTLYLTNITVEEDTVDLKILFPKKVIKDQIKADWFNGIAWVKTGRYKKIFDSGYSIQYENYVFLRFDQGIVKDKTVLTSDEYWKTVNEYFQRRNTKNPVKSGVIFEYAQYINSFKQEDEKHNKSLNMDAQ